MAFIEREVNIQTCIVFEQRTTATSEFELQL